MTKHQERIIDRLIRNVILIALWILIILWGRAQGASWYVNGTNHVGTEVGSSWANSWTSFPQVVWGKVSAGDTLYISGGTVSQAYTVGSTSSGIAGVLIVGTNGVPGNPITISTGQDAGHNGKVILDGGGLTNGPNLAVIVCGGNWVNITGNVGGQTNLFVRNAFGGTDREARNGLFCGAGSSQTISYLGFSNLNNGIHFSAEPGTNVDIHHCWTRDIRGDAAISHAGGHLRFDSVTIRQNDIEHNYATNLTDGGPDGVKFFVGTTMRSNRVWNVPGVVVPGQHPDSFQCAGGGNFCIIDANEIHDPLNAAFEIGTAASLNDLQIINNVATMSNTNLIQGGHPAVAEMGGEFVGSTMVSNVTLAGNTSADFQSGWGWSWDKDGSQPFVFYFRFMDNLLVNCNRSPNLWAVGFGETTNTHVVVGTHLIVDHNSISGSTSNGIIVGGFSAGAYYITQAHGNTTAPIFTSYTPYRAVNNFHLDPLDSAARLQGTNLASFFTTDFEGFTRGATWNIGAMTTNAAFSVSTPAVSTSGRVDFSGRLTITR